MVIIDDYVPLKALEMSPHRRNGYNLARRHGAARTLKIICNRNACYREIFKAALRDVGEERLIEMLSHPRRRYWLDQFCHHFWDRISTQSKRRALLGLKHCDAISLLYCKRVPRPVRRKFFERLSKVDKWAVLEDACPDPPLSKAERTLLKDMK